MVVTAESKVGVEELATLIHDALFEPGGDEDDDCFKTQLEDSRENAHHAACDLLLDKTTARNEKIRYTMQRPGRTPGPRRPQRATQEAPERRDHRGDGLGR